VVYLPYMVVDVNAHACLRGEAEMELRQRYIDSRTTLYDANVYNVERDFDVTISSLTIESSEDKLNRKSKDKTTNIINSIMPFDVENSVKWNSNYLKGYSSEKRDINIDEKETKTKIFNLKRTDKFKGTREGLEYSTMGSANNKRVNG